LGADWDEVIMKSKLLGTVKDDDMNLKKLGGGVNAHKNAGPEYKLTGGKGRTQQEITLKHEK